MSTTAGGPDWITETPGDPTEYRLEMWIDNAGVQSIDITRDEFLALKAHLTALRCYGAPTSAEALATIMDNAEFTGYNTGNEQQTASHLETARDFYAKFPQLVVLPSEAFDEELAAAVADPVE